MNALQERPLAGNEKEDVLWGHAPRGTCTPGCPVNGRCHCPCGMPTSIARQNALRDSVVRGRPRVFLPGHQRAALPYPAGPPFSRTGVPSERVKQLALFLHDEYGTWGAAAEAAGLPEPTLYSTVHRNRSTSCRVARCVVDAVRGVEAARRREAVEPRTMERRHYRGLHIDDPDLDCRMCQKAAAR